MGVCTRKGGVVRVGVEQNSMPAYQAGCSVVPQSPVASQACVSLCSGQGVDDEYLCGGRVMLEEQGRVFPHLLIDWMVDMKCA